MMRFSLLALLVVSAGAFQASLPAFVTPKVRTIATKSNLFSSSVRVVVVDDDRSLTPTPCRNSSSSSSSFLAPHHLLLTGSRIHVDDCPTCHYE